MVGGIIAIGDAHGRYDVLRALLEALAALPLDTAGRKIIFTGDLIDRGRAGLDCVDAAFGPRLQLMNGGTAVMDEADPDDVMSLRERLSVIAARIQAAAAASGIPDWLAATAGFAHRGATSDREAPGDILFVHAGIAPAVAPLAFDGWRGLETDEWTAAKSWSVFIRRKRSIGRSRGRNGRCEFPAVVRMPRRVPAAADTES